MKLRKSGFHSLTTARITTKKMIKKRITIFFSIRFFFICKKKTRNSFWELNRSWMIWTIQGFAFANETWQKCYLYMYNGISREIYFSYTYMFFYKANIINSFLRRWTSFVAIWCDSVYKHIRYFQRTTLCIHFFFFLFEKKTTVECWLLLAYLCQRA